MDDLYSASIVKLDAGLLIDEKIYKSNIIDLKFYESFKDIIVRKVSLNTVEEVITGIKLPLIKEKRLNNGNLVIKNFSRRGIGVLKNSLRLLENNSSDALEYLDYIKTNDKVYLERFIKFLITENELMMEVYNFNRNKEKIKMKRFWKMNFFLL